MSMAKTYGYIVLTAIGVLTLAMAIATVTLVVTDPVRTAVALSARDPGSMIGALASLLWKVVDAVISYL
jgi:hypothetical protein